MRISEELDLEPIDISLIQNRLTVATAVLATLFFSASFSFGLFSSVTASSPPVVDYRLEFIQILCPVALGAAFTILSISGFLYCQHIWTGASGKTSSRRYWFFASSIWLYLGVSQALSAGLVEVVYAISTVSRVTAFLIGATALPAWLMLNFVVPIRIVRGASPERGFDREKKILVGSYVISLATIFGITAAVYSIRGSREGIALEFVKNVALQTIQPLTWCIPW